MTYKEQLAQPEWLAKRRQIIKRDNFQCKLCNKRPKLLGIIKSFGVVSHDQIKSLGYSFKLPLVPNNIAICKDDDVFNVKFYGKLEKYVKINEMRFAKQRFATNDIL